MSAPPRQGWLSGGPGSAAAMLDAVFDRASETFRLDRHGQLWQAVEVARRSAAPPRVVAVVDSGFDLSVGRLARMVHPDSRLPRIPRLQDPHGTLVALLVNEIAPQARLLLVEARQGIQLWSDDVADAVAHAVRCGADVVNLSLEFHSDAQPRHVPGIEAEPLLTRIPSADAVLRQVRLWRDLVEPYADGGCRRECELCRAPGGLGGSRAVVVAASGNLDGPACPACSPGVVGVGFHGREVALVRDGRVVTGQSMPRTDSNLLWEVSVPEPPGFEGTSFAAPLLAGLAAIQDDPAELVAMARLPKLLTPVLLLAHALTRPAGRPGPAGDERPDAAGGERPEPASDERPDPAGGEVPDPAIDDGPDPAALAVWQAAMVEFAQVVPDRHRHWEQDAPDACSPCSLTMVDWYNAFTVLRLVQGDLFQALAMARLAVAVAPRSASAHGNLGEIWSRWRHHLPDRLMPAGLGTRSDYAARARASFTRAAELEPDVPMYAQRAAAP